MPQQAAEDVGGQKSKGDLKRERRALQEAQRIAKGLPVEKPVEGLDKPLKQVEPKATPVVKPSKPVEPEKDKPSPAKEVSSDLAEQRMATKPKELSPLKDLTRQIPTRTADINGLIRGLGHNGQRIHPSFIRIGLKMNKDIIRGSLPRCVAMLLAIRDVIMDYVTPARKELTRDLVVRLRSNVKFLNECRPLSVGMNTAFDFLQHQMTKIPAGKSDADSKQSLFNDIDQYIKDEISLAVNAITVLGAERINKTGDCIMTFSYSLEVKHVLYSAYLQGKKFRVIVVDSGPEYRGLDMVEFLSKLNIHVSYIYINSAPYVIKESTKVLLGAHAILANGYVMSQMGSSQLALLAANHNVPVYVTCATSEFSDAVHTDAFVYNEASLTPDYFKVKNEKLREHFNGDGEEKERNDSLEIVNLLYDVTPPDFVSVVITEKGALPCTSVPAVMRRQVTQKTH